MLLLLHPLRRHERREVQFAVFQFELAHLRDVEGGVAGLRKIREHLPHLRGRLQEELGGVELQAVGVRLDLLLLDAEQDVVWFGIRLVRVVDVVRGDDRDAELARQPEQAGEDGALVRHAMVLDLQEEVPAPEDVAVGGGGFPGLLRLAGKQQPGHLAGQAPGQADQAFGPLR